MIRIVLMSVLLLPFLSCAGGEAGSGLPWTEVVGNAGGGPFDPAPSPDGTRLAWAQPVEGQAAIHVANIDGSNPRRLSFGTWDSDPRWSPDGRWIAFAGESPLYDLFVVPSDGSAEPRQLTSGPANDVPSQWLPALLPSLPTLRLFPLRRKLMPTAIFWWTTQPAT